LDQYTDKSQRGQGAIGVERAIWRQQNKNPWGFSLFCGWNMPFSPITFLNVPSCIRWIDIKEMDGWMEGRVRG